MGDAMEVDEPVVTPGEAPEGAPATKEEEAVGQLEDEARRRKERLKALRQKLVGAPPEDDKSEIKKINAPLPK